MAKKQMARAKQLKSGNWNVQVFTGFDANGKRIRKSFTAPTRWEAERKAAEFIQNGRKEERSVTVGEALDGYIRCKENVLAPSTLRGYRTIRKNRLQSLMNLDIREVNNLNLQLAINENSKTVGWKSINEAKALIMTALKMYGVRLDLNVTLPARKPKIKELPTAEQVIKLIRGTDIELPCMLAMWLSLRISEVRGLQFGDLKGNVLTVRRSNVYFDGQNHIREFNKTFNSTRQLMIPTYLKRLIESVPHASETDFIVDMEYQAIYDRFHKLLAENGLKLTLHDLRHLSASVMLMLNIPDKYAMERGGWSTNATLKSVYQHTFSEERKQVDEKIDSYFNGILGI